MVITIDGPAGTGKSTICVQLGQALGFFQLDTGAMFRALAYHALQKKIPLEEEPLCQLLQEMQLELRSTKKGMGVFVQNEDIGAHIRTPEIGNLASHLGTFKKVREILLKMQRAYREKYSLITEGRDMGTVVFPDAELKFFLDADPKVRANRRLKDYQEKGEAKSFEDVLDEIIKRDKQDRERPIAPLKPAEDAILIDTSLLSFAEVQNEMLKKIKQRFPSLLSK
ncbi:MAG: (d)CMP kinase [Planctomycetota bacterium]